MEILIPPTLPPPPLQGTPTGIPAATPLPGWRITRPLEKLLAMYLEPARASRDFDLYIAQRRAIPGWQDRIEGADLYATLLMSSQITRTGSAVPGIRANGGLIHPPLRRLPDRDLGAMSDQEFRGLQGDVQQLFQAVGVPPIQLATASKLLCQKRPYLIPMMDRYVQAALGFRPPLPVQSAVPCMERFRHLMRARATGGWSNLGVLTFLATNVTDAVSKHLWGLKLAAAGPTVATAPNRDAGPEMAAERRRSFGSSSA